MSRLPVTVDPTSWDFSAMDAPWEQQPGESPVWFQRFVVYRDLGVHRSLRNARAQVQQAHPRDWETYAGFYRWLERCRYYDDYRYRESMAKRDEVFSTGLALAHERVDALKTRAAVRGQIVESIEQEIVNAKSGERSDKVMRHWITASKIYADTLGDIAAEVGGRSKAANVVRSIEEFCIDLARQKGYSDDEGKSVAALLIEGAKV
jgi:hypothetical protein